MIDMAHTCCGPFFCYTIPMTKPNHHDVNYFKQRISSQHSTDLSEMKSCLSEIEEILNGIEKGFLVLKKVGKYPDKKVLENRDSFEELKTLYKVQINKLK